MRQRIFHWVLPFLFSVQLFSAHAESRAGAATLTLGGGYEFFASKRQIDNTGVGLGIIGYDFTRHWGIEALLGTLKTHSRRTDDYNKAVSGTLFAVDGVYHFKSYHNVLEPFLLAGVGVTGLSPNGTDPHNEGNINAGVGAQYFFGRAVAVRAEARDWYTIDGGKNDVILDAGVTFFWDVC